MQIQLKFKQIPAVWRKIQMAYADIVKAQNIYAWRDKRIK